MVPEAVFSFDPESAAKAASLAGSLALPLVQMESTLSLSSKEHLRGIQQNLGQLPALVLLCQFNVLHLALVESARMLHISTDFHGSTINYRRRQGGTRSEMIARAVGVKGCKLPSVLDATAGLGLDAFVLAFLGCRVRMLERVSVVHALLQDGLARSLDYASRNDTVLASILNRMELILTDADDYLRDLAETQRPDVIYLDPMFPERRKTAAVKKEMQVLHHLVGTDQDADQILAVALTLARERVVVKRPRIADSLSGPKPSLVIEGKRNRYDIYFSGL